MFDLWKSPGDNAWVGPAFKTFKVVLVDRFEAQVCEAWKDSPPIDIRSRAFPCECDECDGLWAWYKGHSVDHPERTSVDWYVPWCLVSPKARSQMLGYVIVMSIRDDRVFEWGHVESMLGLGPRGEAEFEEVFAALTLRQRWCVLKMLVWSHLESFQRYDFETVARFREAMGHHRPWPRPRLRPQT